MGEHFDDLETRDPEAREADLFGALPEHLANSIAKAPGWARQLDGVDLANVTSREALAALPVLRKADLAEMQRSDPPLGGLTTMTPTETGRIFMSPGPIFEPEGHGEDWWRSARGLYAAGFRSDDLVHNTFAFHLTPGAWILDSGIRALGCTVIAAGVGNTEQQVEAIDHLKPTAYAGVPDFLKILLDKAEEEGKDASSITKALVSGGPLFPSLRQEYADRGISVFQSYATAELGFIAYETEALEGMIVDEGVILEIVRPGTGDPVAEGEVGEVVVTSFNPDYPMVRLATGDLSAVLAGTSPCGRTNMRIKGWMGRADQTTKVKGMFVHPSQIADIARRHPELGRLRLEVTRKKEQDVMTLLAECQGGDDALSKKVAETLKAATKLRGDVRFVEADSLPNDGLVISDERDFG